MWRSSSGSLPAESVASCKANKSEKRRPIIGRTTRRPIIGRTTRRFITGRTTLRDLLVTSPGSSTRAGKVFHIKLDMHADTSRAGRKHPASTLVRLVCLAVEIAVDARWPVRMLTVLASGHLQGLQSVGMQPRELACGATPVRAKSCGAATVPGVLLPSTGMQRPVVTGNLITLRACIQYR